MNRILLAPDEVVPDGAAVLRDARARHVREVLRAAPGDTIRVGLLDGPRGMATVTRMADEQVSLACTFEDAVPDRPRVDLLLALPRPKVMKRLWAQLAALGVGRIALVNAARVERCYFDSHVIAPDFFRPLLVEGLQQAGDTRLPEVSIHRRFRPFVEDELEVWAGGAACLLAQPGPGRAVGTWAGGQAPGRALLAVGPEGGWVPFELELFARRGFAPLSLGARTLRTDTACIALLALVHAALADGAVAVFPG